MIISQCMNYKIEYQAQYIRYTYPRYTDILS